MVIKDHRNLPTMEVEKGHEMIKKYVDENGVKTVYLCLFGKRYIWKDGVYQGWYRA